MGQVTIGPQPGAQTDFLSSPADIVLYGGLRAPARLLHSYWNPYDIFTIRTLMGSSFVGKVSRHEIPVD